LILDALGNFSGLNREKVIIDHVEEHTAAMVLDQGYWAGMTLYPESKCTPNRAIDMLETLGSERLWLNSACDWGISDPLAVPKCAIEMKKREHTAAFIEKVVYENPARFLSQAKNFSL
jgi:predicted metal-dependent TIM-barrel fold hydrolase